MVYKHLCYRRVETYHIHPKKDFKKRQIQKKETKGKKGKNRVEKNSPKRTLQITELRQKKYEPLLRNFSTDLSKHKTIGIHNVLIFDTIKITRTTP